MRVGILSDTHDVLDEDVAGCLEGSDLILHAGDIGGPAVLDRLAQLCDRQLAVIGNNDTCAKWPAVGHAQLQALPESLHVELPGGILAMEHGHRIWDTKNYHRRLRMRHPGARAIVYGHTHIQIVDQSQASWVLNPGAAGRQRTKLGPSCLLLEAGSRGWHVEAYRFGKKAGRRVA